MNFLNIPNVLTLLRIVLIPILFICFYLPTSWAHITAAWIFVAAAVTDWLDGYLARVLQQGSAFGAFLDPVADKLLVAISLVLLVGEGYLPYLVAPATVIIGREIAISALREWMSELGNRTSVAVSYIGKVKTVLQLAAIPMLLAYTSGVGGIWKVLMVLGYILLYLATVLTIWSMVVYLKAAWPDLTAKQLKLPFKK